MSYISAVSTNDKVLVWERNVDGERVLQAFDAPHYLYIEDPDGEYESIYGDKATKLTFKNRSDYYKAKKEIIATGLKTFEADISAELRVLSNKYYNIPAPKLHVTMYDIEVDYDPAIGFSSVKNPYAPINAIAVVHEWNKQLVVFAVPPPGFVQITNDSFIQQMNAISPIDESYQLKLTICADESELLTSFLAEIHDSDVICGWNSDWFDTPYVAKRVGMVLGKVASKRLCFDGAGDPKWREVERFSVYGSAPAELEEVVDLQGRIGADYLDLFKKYEVADRGSFKLENISEEILVDENGVPMLPKLEYKGTLAALYRSNFISFIRYNIRDVEILHGFEERLGYVELANQMYHLSTGLFHHVSGTIKLADLALINYCHHELKKIVPTSKAPEIDRQIAGALVLLPQVGMHEFVGSIDINSLYPGAIRSINISPETLVGQFDECVGAFELITKRVSNPLTLRLESGQSITKPANEWGAYLEKHSYSISGYGTVFDQKREGIIPKILSSWYAERKRFQALKKEAENKAEAIMQKYNSKS